MGGNEGKPFSSCVQFLIIMIVLIYFKQIWADFGEVIFWTRVILDELILVGYFRMG